MKIYWVSRHDMSPAQIKAVKALHGEDAEIVKDPVVLAGADGLKKYLESHRDGFVYAVAGAVHYLTAALEGGNGFGIFENHPARRQDGSFGLAAVYHLKVWSALDGGDWLYNQDTGIRPLPTSGPYICAPSVLLRLEKVWENPDPMSDEGEKLIPVAR